MNDLSKDAVNRLAVDEAGVGQRVDNFLLRVLKGVPKSHIYRILRSGEVRVNRLRVKPDARLVLGDILRIPPIRTGIPAAGTRKAPPLSPSIPILYEDDALIAVNKPAGLAVHGGSGVSFGLIEQMRATRPTAKFLELVHRLDRDTSGVILIAKKRSALVGLHSALREGRVDKRYQILVKGHWRDAKRAVTLPLTKFLTSSGERRVRVEEEEGGQTAKTVFYRQQVWTDIDPPMSLLEAELFTGRTHQIRVHLTHLGYALAGDEKYGDFAWNKALSKQGLKRMFLHARKLVFAHPVEEREVEIEAALPLELSRFLDTLNSSRRADA